METGTEVVGELIGAHYGCQAILGGLRAGEDEPSWVTLFAALSRSEGQGGLIPLPF